MNAILIDNEFNARQTLKQKLHTHCPNVEIVGEANNVEKAIYLIKKLTPDLLFMDILMENQLSFNILSAFPNARFRVIFVTSHNESEYILNAFHCNATDYVLKPINVQKLIEAVRRVEQLQIKEGIWEGKNNAKHKVISSGRLFLQTYDGIQVVLLHQIIYISTSDNPNFVLFYLSNSIDCQPLIINSTLKEQEYVLSKFPNFCRIHNSHIVNLNFLEKYNLKNLQVKMQGGRELKISRQRKDNFLMQLEKAL